MNIKKQFTTVTPVSKSIALGMMIALPFLGFYAGKMFYQSPLLVTDQTQTFGASAITQDGVLITFTNPEVVQKDNKTSDMKPRTDYQFVMTDITLTNQGSKSSAMFSTLSQRVLLTDNDNIPYAVSMFGHADRNFVDQILQPGQSVKALAIFEIPTDSQAKSILFADHTITFQ